MTWEDYQKLLGAGRSALEALAQPGGEDIEFDPPGMSDNVLRPVDFD
jgi:hypothetical protein